MWTTFVIFKKLTKINIHPMDKNSPNRATMVIQYILKDFQLPFE
jgi:hypothetical protein